MKVHAICSGAFGMEKTDEETTLNDEEKRCTGHRNERGYDSHDTSPIA